MAFSMTNAVRTLLLTAAMATGALAALPGHADEIHDQRALSGLETGKGIFDIGIGNPDTIARILEVVEETMDGMEAQGVTPDLIVAFRGPSTRFLAADEDLIPFEHQVTAERIAERIRRLADRGVRIEACHIALRGVGVGPEQLLEPITPVANTFNSLIGYQAKGYALIPIL